MESLPGVGDGAFREGSRISPLVADVEPNAAGEEGEEHHQPDLLQPIDGDQVPVDVVATRCVLPRHAESMAYSIRPGLPVRGSSKYTAAFFPTPLNPPER